MTPRYVRTLLLIVPLIVGSPAVAQILEGAVAGGGLQSVTAADVAMDDTGNKYITGTFNGTATFGEHSITAIDEDPSAVRSDAFLVKYDASGEAVWARRGGTAIFNTFGHNVATGPDGSVYWSGLTTALSTFDGGNNPDGELVAVSLWEGFIAKYDQDGNLLWVTGVLGAGNNSARSMVVDAEGNVYLVGSVEGNAAIGDLTFNSISGTDGFVAKLDSDGIAQWAIALGGSQSNAGHGVDLHPDGGVVVSGQFRGVATFGNIPLQSAGGVDSFAARVDVDGNVLWASRFGAQGDEFNRGVAVAIDGSVYLTGSFEQEILIGTDILVSPGFSTVYVVKLNADGTQAWGRRIGGNNFDFGEDITLDAEGNVYAVGYVDGAVTVSTGNGDQTTQTAGDSDGFLLVYSPDGDLISLDLIGGTNRDRGQGVAVNDLVGRVAVAGWFRGSFVLGDDTVTSAGGNDVFLAFGDTHAGPVVSTDPSVTPLALSLVAYPNPVASSLRVEVSAEQGQEIRVSVVDLLGREVAVLADGPAPGRLSLHFDTSSLPSGVYLVNATGSDSRVVRRITVLR